MSEISFRLESCSTKYIRDIKEVFRLIEHSSTDVLGLTDH